MQQANTPSQAQSLRVARHRHEEAVQLCEGQTLPRTKPAIQQQQQAGGGRRCLQTRLEGQDILADPDTGTMNSG